MIALKTPRSRLTVKIKLRKCAICRTPFEKRSMGHTACSVPCSLIVSERKKAAKARKELAQGRAKLKSYSDLIKDAQFEFNRFIRLRDANQTCIDCGKPFEPQKMGGSVDAGHYLSRGSASHLRFDERNVHAQRKNCNRPGGTTRAAFREGILARIGSEALAALESDFASREYTREDLIALKLEYRAKWRALSKARND